MNEYVIIVEWKGWFRRKKELVFSVTSYEEALRIAREFKTKYSEMAFSVGTLRGDLIYVLDWIQ